MKRSMMYLLLCIMVISAISVQAASTNGTAQREPVKLVLANHWTGARIPLMDEQLREFERLYPWVTVENQVGSPGQTADQKYTVAIISGAGPDVWMVQRNRVPEFVEKGLLQPLDAFMEQEAFSMSIFYPSEQASCQYKNNTYVLPMPAASLSLLYYNRTLLAEGGYSPDKPPATWDEMLAMALRLQRISPDGRVEISGGDIKYLPTFRLAQFAYANGAQIFNGPFDINYLTDEVRQTVNWGMEWVQRVPAGGAMALGTLVFEPYGEWYYFDLQNRAPDLDVGIALLPHGPSGELQNIVGGGWSYGIPADAKHPYESWLLVKFLTASEAARNFAFSQARPSPVIKYTQDRRYFDQNPYWHIIGETLNRSVVVSPTPVMQQILNADIRAWQAVMKGQESPEAILTKLQNDVDVIIADYLRTANQ